MATPELPTPITIDGIPPSEPVPPVPGQTPDPKPLVPDPLEPIIDPDDGVTAPVRLPGHEDKPPAERVAAGAAS